MKKRFLFDQIVAHLKSTKVTVIVGARQTGKTTILKQIEAFLLQRGDRCFSFTLEDYDILSDFNHSPKNLLNAVETKGDGRVFVLIDEIQYLKDPSNFLKLIYDGYREKIKLIVTGSSSFYMDRGFKDSLAGRKRIFPLYSMSFGEFLHFKGVSPRSAKTLAGKREISGLFTEYLIWGGYPEVVMSQNEDERMEVLRELIYSYIRKDILEQKIKREDKFFQLLKFLSHQAGGLLNKNEVARNIGVSTTAVDNYLYFSQKSFHIFTLKPLYKNRQKEIVKMGKVFFGDCGILNFLRKDFRKPEDRGKSVGSLLENAFFINLLYRVRDVEDIKFWRDKAGHEIDFVVNETTGFELTFGCGARGTKQKNLNAFHQSFSSISVSVLCRDDVQAELLRYPRTVGKVEF